jgi:23S rRNA (uracil1939-C5)-methyltransferase
MDFFTTVKEQPYKEETHSGNIRHIGFRVSRNNEIIVIIVTKKSRLAFTNGLIRTLIENYPTITGIVQNINPTRGNTIVSEHDKLLFGEAHFFEDVLGLKFKVNYQSFFQVNLKIADLLFQFIIQHLQKKDIVIDAFCGIGIIALLIAKSVTKVIGIESNKQAYKDALENAAINSVENVSFSLGKVEELLANLLQNDVVNTIIFDPPRKGLDASILEIVCQSNIEKIIYISCDPLTQKRDVASLLKENFSIEEIQPFDMFPHTFHIENVIILKRL